jgi:phosphate starvation-inducible PhoH-like protein
MAKKPKPVKSEPLESPKRIKFWNESQRICVDTILGNDLTFVTGPAGTSKTFCAMAAGSLALKQGYEKIMFTRAIVPGAGEDLGWLGGSVAERTGPWMAPLYDNAKKTGIQHDDIQISPLSYMRGVTFSDCFAFLDEGQNVTLPQMKLYLSRLGRGSKMVICGDAEQCDIKDGCLELVISKLLELPGVAVHRFDESHIVRHTLVGRILEALK